MQIFPQFMLLPVCIIPSCSSKTVFFYNLRILFVYFRIRPRPNSLPPSVLFPSYLTTLRPLYSHLHLCSLLLDFIWTEIEINLRIIFGQRYVYRDVVQFTSNILVTPQASISMVWGSIYRLNRAVIQSFSSRPILACSLPSLPVVMEVCSGHLFTSVTWQIAVPQPDRPRKRTSRVSGLEPLFTSP